MDDRYVKQITKSLNSVSVDNDYIFVFKFSLNQCLLLVFAPFHDHFQHALFPAPTRSSTHLQRAFNAHTLSRPALLSSLATVCRDAQVTFGALQAAQFGVPQSRRRMFVLAAAPGTPLPRLPTPTHTFTRVGTQLSVALGDRSYCPIPARR